MKKTLTINLSGLVFHIDEDAFEKLKSYLDAIKRYYKNGDGEEILRDVESRIAELFQERLNNRNQVICMADVNNLIEVMGKPEDFTDGEAEEYEVPKQTHARYKRHKRLYRDPENRMLGGVCSGLAHYLGVDVVIVRLVFVLLLFTGVGVIVYLILWVVTPEANSSAQKLEMMGEPVNLNNIGRMVRDEVNEVRDRYNI